MPQWWLPVLLSVKTHVVYNTNSESERKLRTSSENKFRSFDCNKHVIMMADADWAEGRWEVSTPFSFAVTRKHL